MNYIKILKDYFYQKKHPAPFIYSIYDTIDLILTQHLSVSRFGDGELDLLLNINQPKFQKTNPLLVKKLYSTLNTKNKNLLVCLPKTFCYNDLNNLNNKAKRHWLKFISKNRKSIYNILNFDIRYGNALFTRNYIDLKDKSNSINYFNKIKQIWYNKNIIIIEGRFTRFGVNNDLLTNAKSVKRILCPEKNAFDQYDKILDCALTQPKDVLFLIALGPTATVLSNDLSEKGYQAIDIGHLDIEYEWFLSGANTKSKVNYKYVNETDDIITDSNDTLKNELYESQIIKKIC